MTKMVLFLVSFVFGYIVYYALIEFAVLGSCTTFILICIFKNLSNFLFFFITDDASLLGNIILIIALYLILLFGFGSGFINNTCSTWKRFILSKFFTIDSQNYSSDTNLPEQLRKIDFETSTESGCEHLPST